MTGRFAPSPTGRMHLGNIYSALLSWLSARSQGGSWILRMEDIDQGRSRAEYADLIREDLKWLGLTWDEEYTQSQRFSIYEQHLERLRATGLTYPCYCTRADIMATQAPHESDGRVVYKGTCRPRITPPCVPTSPTSPASTGVPSLQIPNRRPATRLIVPNEAITFTDGHYGTHTVNLVQQCGDFIIRRGDGAWAYQLAVVVDDALMGVTEVVRGRDLLLSVPQQMYLFGLLGYESPRYCHLPLLCNEAGQRLSKRDKSLDMACLRSCFTAEEIIGHLAHLAGLTDTDTAITAEDLIPLFSWNKVPVNDIICNLDYSHYSIML